jgi:uncharacterized protein (DUF4415 family)
MKKAKGRKNSAAILKVSQDDYQAELDHDVAQEFALKPGRHVFRRARWVTKPEETQLRNCKVRITMFLDADILEYFKTRAAKPHAAPYQTQINETLREVMERDIARKADRTGEYKKLLESPGFIEAVAKRVEAQTSRRRKTG